jgi:hypothetical protein
MIDITIQNFETELIQASAHAPVLLDIWAPWWPVQIAQSGTGKTRARLRRALHAGQAQQRRAA